METIRKIIFSDVLLILLDHLVLFMVIMTSMQGRLDLAVAGLAVYFIGQHPRYVSSRGKDV